MKEVFMSEKVATVREYTFALIGLMILLGLTLGLSYLNLKGLNTVAGLAIATVKALLVALYFMHIKKSTGLHRVFAAAGVFWLGILMVLSLADYVSRSWLMFPGNWPQWLPLKP